MPLLPDEFDRTGRRGVSDKDLNDALKGVLLAPRGTARSENRQPSKEELAKRYRLDRHSRRT